MMLDIDKYIKTQFNAIGSYTAGTTFPTSEGEVINSSGFASGELALGYKVLLGSDETLDATVYVKTSPDNANWSAYKTLAEFTGVALGTASTLPIIGTENIGYNFQVNDKFVRFKVELELSAASTDTVDWAFVTVFGGADNMPVI